MKFTLKLLAAVSVITMGFAGPGAAQDKTKLEVFHAWAGHQRFHKPIAEEFMAQNPDIEIEFRAPGADYGAAHLSVLRASLADDLPDVYYSGYHLLPPAARILSEREVIVPLTDFIAAEGDGWIEENYAPNIIALGAVDGVQYAMPFNASTPIVHYNADLIRQAGGDPENLPTNWDELIELAAKINALGDETYGMSYDAHNFWDDWLFQALIKQAGGRMMSEDETAVAWNNEIGLDAMKLAVRFVEEGGMPLITKEESVTLFCAGKKGIHFTSTASVRRFGECSEGNFEYVTGTYPVTDTENGGVPTGGNAAMILTSDKKKQEAAWRFVKFVSGPKGQEIAVLGSGYMPTNKLAAGPDYLGDHYENFPNWTTSLKQIERAQTWYGYPGTNSVKIGRVQMEIFAELMNGDLTPEAALEAMVAETEALLPRN
ncbi:ABC transporter substrate-binding protein [Roseibium sp.]|uniref:ABC transporter substrate-binding protein n=1 Tax=Roseibium sp. TaxID=1936156 RepID=UPI003B51195B